MCQSRANGGKRCVEQGRIESNYPHIVNINHKSKTIELTTGSFDDNPAIALHVAVLAARSGYTIDETTRIAAEAASTKFDTLSKKQIWEQWNQMLLAENPSEGLKALHSIGWEHHFPELAAIRGVPQSPEWHPEGDVEVHTQQAADVAARLAKNDNLNPQETRIAVMSAICHDFGKSVSTKVAADGSISSADHDKTGVPLAKSFLERIGTDKDTLREVPILVREHMCHVHTPTPRSLRNLVARLDGVSIQTWSRLAEADRGGRGTASTSGVSKEWLELNEVLQKENVTHFRRIIDGKFLRDLGSTDYDNFGSILRLATKAQHRGIVTNEETAMKWLQENKHI